LLIWGVPKQIYSMNVRNMVLRKDDDHWIDMSGAYKLHFSAES
jgi:hypothetical protein